MPRNISQGKKYKDPLTMVLAFDDNEAASILSLKLSYVQNDSPMHKIVIDVRAQIITT